VGGQKLMHDILRRLTVVLIMGVCIGLLFVGGLTTNADRFNKDKEVPQVLVTG
jgi:hypothetical protein